MSVPETRGVSPSLAPLSGRTIAVFGSSEPLPGSELYGQAREIGRLLGLARARVVNGGYGGVMEAASRGAHEVGGAAIGVTCALFGNRTPNEWLSETMPARDLFDRTRLLIDLADAFIILPGKSGTIAELAFVWALDRAGALGEKPLALCGGSWRGLLDVLERIGALEDEQRRLTGFAETPEHAVIEVARRMAMPPSRGR